MTFALENEHFNLLHGIILTIHILLLIISSNREITSPCLQETFLFPDLSRSWQQMNRAWRLKLEIPHFWTLTFLLSSLLSRAMNLRHLCPVEIWNLASLHAVLSIISPKHKIEERATVPPISTQWPRRKVDIPVPRLFLRWFAQSTRHLHPISLTGTVHLFLAEIHFNLYMELLVQIWGTILMLNIRLLSLALHLPVTILHTFSLHHMIQYMKRLLISLFSNHLKLKHLPPATPLTSLPNHVQQVCHNVWRLLQNPRLVLLRSLNLQRLMEMEVMLPLTTIYLPPVLSNEAILAPPWEVKTRPVLPRVGTLPAPKIVLVEALSFTDPSKQTSLQILADHHFLRI